MNRLRPGAVAGAIVWAAAGLCLLWALVRTLGLERGFPLTAVIAWTPFVLLAAFIVATAAAFLRSWGALAVATVAMFLLLVAVLPRASGDGHRPSGANGPGLVVLSANLKLGSAEPDAVVDLLDHHEIEVLCLQELTLEGFAGLERAGLAKHLPHHVAKPGESSSGSAIYSRYPLRELRDAQPAEYPFAMPRAEVRVPGAGPVTVVSVHTVPPTGSDAVDIWEEGLVSLPPGGTGVPNLLIGDFNATLDHREFREVVDRGYVDAADAVGGGLAPTWPERLVRPGVTIDHVLADARIAITDYEVHELPGSDHRAVSATLQLP